MDNRLCYKDEDKTAGASCARFCANVCQIFQPQDRQQCFFDCLACSQRTEDARKETRKEARKAKHGDIWVKRDC
jgi:hypothetical protein